jgi:hypothetical protein
MAVINIDPNERWGPINQAFAQAAPQILQGLIDKAAVENVLKIAGQSQGQGMQGQPSIDRQQQPSVDQANVQVEGQPGSTSAQQPGSAIATAETPLATPQPAAVEGTPTVPKPPDIPALMAAAGTSARAQKVVQGIVHQYDQALREQAAQLAHAKEAREAAHQKFGEEHTLVTEDIARRRLAISEAGEAREEEKYPLMMRNLRQTGEKNALEITNLVNQQKGVWSADEIKRAAESYAAGGFTQPPNFGWGQGANAVNRSNFWREVMAGPMTPDQRRQAQILYQTQHAEAQTAGRQLANLNININKSEQLYKPLKASLDKLKPILSNAPMWNSFKRAVETGTGDPAFSGADIYVQSFLITYAKALNPNGVTAEGLRNEVHSFLNTVASPEQLDAKLEAIRTDLNLEREAVKGGVADILGQGQNFGILRSQGATPTPSQEEVSAAGETQYATDGKGNYMKKDPGGKWEPYAPTGQ